MSKPRVFVASASESLDVANAVNLNLDHDAEVTVWQHGFELSTDNITSLVKKARSSDFAVFVFTPDDVTTIRDRTQRAVRDNVLFELGLFVGSLGYERCFILKPRGEDLHIPSDLLGMGPADYEAARSDGNLGAAVNAFCFRIRTRIRELGQLPAKAESAPERRRIPRYDYAIGSPEMAVLSELTEGHVASPDGSTAWQIINSATNAGREAVSLGILKLERLGLIKRSIGDGEYEPHFTYALTAEGIDYVLEHEADIGLDPRSAEPETAYDDVPF